MEEELLCLEIIASELGLPIRKEVMEQLTSSAFFYDDLYQKTFKLPKEKLLMLVEKVLTTVEDNPKVYQTTLRKVETWKDYSHLSSDEDPFATIAREKQKLKK